MLYNIPFGYVLSEEVEGFLAGIVPIADVAVPQLLGLFRAERAVRYALGDERELGDVFPGRPC